MGAAVRASTPVSLVAALSPINLPTANPGGTVSAPVTIIASNATRDYTLVFINVTQLQTKSGNVIPSSSIRISPRSPVTISGVKSLEVSVEVPDGTKPGNYTGRLILVGADGAATIVTINVQVQYDFGQYLGVYWSDLLLIFVGVALSFIYSPFGDKPTPKAGHSLANPMARFSDKKSFLAILTTPTHLAILLSAVSVGVTTFVYFLTATPGFGLDPVHDAAISVIDGFTVHRLLDGTAGKG